jgi:L-asparaginase / beta-aspartyl-peptidase
MRALLIGSEGSAGLADAVAALQKDAALLDVVEAGLRPVEVDPAIRTVGIGGRPNLLGQLELDASIMDGTTFRTGAVGALIGYLHPISVARQVLERLPHVFLVGEGAARFAAEIGADPGPSTSRLSQQEWAAWVEAHVPAETRSRWPDMPLAEWARRTTRPETAHGTAILLASDAGAHLAAGVSTSGWAYKYPGRLGDSPVIGAGCYADSRWGAAACTGAGEWTIRAGTARAVVLYLKMGLSLERACREAAGDLRALRRDYAGGVTIHALDTEGRPYVLVVGDMEPEPYFYWAEGMAAPEERLPVIEGWG